ncbi:hypothetical protein [Vibrio owensii]|uniref:hypothetical protein n=1 Tax=Vibrio owensii TaxID=696485 RepID=UPI0018F13644|nr:hypothetical protein [Vibrio owensii]
MRKWARTVRELNQRERTSDSKSRLSHLFQLVHTGVNKKKRYKHYTDLLNELTKAGAYIPLLQPSATPDRQTKVGIFLHLDIIGKGKHERLTLNNIVLDYNNKVAFRENTDNKRGGFCLTFKNHHSISRFFQRENREAFVEALIRFYDAAYNVREQIDSHVGPCNILVSNGGLLLGECIKDENDISRFVAGTYLSADKIMGHNFENLFVPDLALITHHETNGSFITLNKRNAAHARKHAKPGLIDQLIEHNLLKIEGDMYDLN